MLTTLFEHVCQLASCLISVLKNMCCLNAEEKNKFKEIYFSFLFFTLKHSSWSK